MSTDKRTVWIQATVMILLAGLAYVMVAAYARGWGQTAELLENPEMATPVINGPTGAPTREQVAQLHENLRKKFGTNARGRPRVVHLDYDGWPDRMHVVFSLDHNPLTMTPAQAAELRPLLDVLQAVHAGGLQWRWVLVSGTGPLENLQRQVTEATAVRAVFAREKLDRVDWSHIKMEDLTGMAEQFTLDPSLTGGHKLLPAKGDASPAKSPPVTEPRAVVAPDTSTQSSKKSK